MDFQGFEATSIAYPYRNDIPSLVSITIAIAKQNLY